MGPTELTVSGLIALAAVLPISAMYETASKPEAVEPELKAEVRIMSDYVVKPDCVGSDGKRGPCVVCRRTGEQLGIGVQIYSVN